MKKIITIILILPALWAKAQDPSYPAVPAAAGNIVAAEYWIDTDPGVGNGTAIPVSPGVDIANTVATINTTGLSNGIHRYGLRTKSADGIWSLTNIQELLVDYNPTYAQPPATITDIVAAEYFIDTDPGVGNGTQISITPGQDISNINIAANTTGLSNSTHYLFLRSKNSNGVWSLTNIHAFLVNTDFSYPPAPAAPGNIIYAEYFFDTDPGFGNGNIISITPGVDLNNVSFSANTSGLNDGTHTLFIRSLDDWSITNFVSFTKGNVLAVNLLEFTAVASGNDVLLNWQTATTELNDKMILQRSNDGVHFSDIITVKSKAVPSSYNYKDEKPFNGKNYYRIKIVDKDNVVTYSSTALVNIETNGVIALQAYPNPATDKLYLKITGTVEPGAQISICNLNGKEVIRQQLVAQNQSINLSGLSNGVYLLRFTNGHQQQTIKIVKQ